jgi:hypothetical protein
LLSSAAHLMPGGPLGIRSNNWLNVHQAGNQVWRGTTGYNWDLGPGHVSFSSPQLGARAGALNLITKIQNGQDTIRSIIFGQPGRDNAYTGRVSDRPYYAQAIVDATGIGLDDTLSVTDANQLLSVMRAMTQYENSVVPANFDQVASAGLQQAYDYKGINDPDWNYRPAPSEWAPDITPWTGHVNLPEEQFPLGDVLGFPQGQLPPLEFGGDPFSPSAAPFDLSGGVLGGGPSDFGFVDPGQYMMPGGASPGGNAIGSFGGNTILGQNVPPFNDYGWQPANYGSPGSASVGGNGIAQFGGNLSPGPEVSPFEDLWTSIANGVGAGGPSIGGNDIAQFAGGLSPGPEVSPFEDLWTPTPTPADEGSPSVGGHDITGFGGDLSVGPGISPFEDLWTPINDGGGEALTDWQSAINQYGYGGFYYDAQGNVVPLDHAGGGNLSTRGQQHSPILDLTGILHQNLSDRPAADIPAQPFGPGQTSSYINAAGETVRPSGTGFGYSPSSIYNAAGQYLGANSANIGFGAGVGTNIGGIMGSNSSWNHFSGGGNVTGNASLGGDTPTAGRGEGPGGEWEDTGTGRIFHFGVRSPGPTGHQGHLAGKAF